MLAQCDNKHLTYWSGHRGARLGDLRCKFCGSHLHQAAYSRIPPHLPETLNDSQILDTGVPIDLMTRSLNYVETCARYEIHKAHRADF